ncbi:hypothetical protein Vqi01_59000 [Micromonospora qiuiae]|uniref:Carboxymuconolactone decarboxylase-like domain-containing protein n=1 Tax=Micromonospora qiuiae TaxID=502268 RepID=A0ABQ4JJF3_9ACTN|nr:hypothetical protein [Micromonospora qiuiae]GIJ30738.1 hypothetical protein Vqi01_59000 [Micromonospora qiuiae]
MAESRIPADFYDDKVQPRRCDKPPAAGLNESPRHPRPAGVTLEMTAIYAVDYGVKRSEGGRLQPMDLRPILDALAAHWDQCSTCLAHHTAAIAASPPLTTHLVGTALFALNIQEASARLVIQKLDPDGCALALTIRNSGLDAAVALADFMGPERRQSAVGIALNVLAPTGWLDTPVSNLCPPVARPARPSSGDAEMLSDLRSGGHLP